MMPTLPEIQIRRILYPTDLSDGARQAFAYAVNLANQYCAQLIILHVVDTTPEMVDHHVIGYIGAEEWEKIKQNNIDETREILIGKRRGETAIREVLDRFCANLRPGSDDQVGAMDETLVVQGNPVKEILKTAKEKSCDLIVMGSHGQGALMDAMMGSTTSRVLRRSQTPVLVVRLPEE
ncbi:MAG: universal stress protein [Desulfobacterales bacterium]|jgi:nucleotide-binding universal stress UspA family protein